MLRKLTAIALCATSLVIASDKQTTVASRYLMANSQKHNLTHDELGFNLNDQRLLAYDIDPSLRGINNLDQLKGSKILVNGARYKIERHQQLKGGGAGGAWLGSWLGYGSVMAGSKVVTGLIVWPIALVCPPAAIAVGAVLETVVPVVIQPIALTAGVAGGIALGTATGPI